MTPNDDDDLLARFNRRLAGIESDVKDGFPAEIPGPWPVTPSIAWRSESPGRRVLVPLFVAIALIASIAVIRPLLVNPTPSASPVGSLPAVGGSSRPSTQPGDGPADLRIQAYLKGQPEPPGIAIAPVLSGIHFRAVVTNVSESEVLTIPADLGWRELSLTPGRYEVVVSERTEVVDADNGKNIISSPFGQCSVEVDLSPGMTMSLTALGDGVCTTGTTTVIPSVSPAPSAAFVPVSPKPPSPLPNSLVSKAQAIVRAREEVSADAVYEWISAGAFGDLELTPDRSSLGLLVAPDHLVWAIHFSNSSATCSAENTCGETVVYLDYVRGNFLVSVRVPAAP